MATHSSVTGDTKRTTFTADTHAIEKIFYRCPLNLAMMRLIARAPLKSVESKVKPCMVSKGKGQVHIDLTSEKER